MYVVVKRKEDGFYAPATQQEPIRQQTRTTLPSLLAIDRERIGGAETRLPGRKDGIVV